MTSLRASDDTNAPPTKFQLVICVCGKLYYSWHTTQIVCAHGEKFVQILGHYMIIIVLVSIKSETHNFSTHDTITHNVKFCVCIILILWHWFYNCPQLSNIWSIGKDRCSLFVAPTKQSPTKGSLCLSYVHLSVCPSVMLCFRWHHMQNTGFRSLNYFKIWQWKYFVSNSTSKCQSKTSY